MPYKQGVAGSSPVAPTIVSLENGKVAEHWEVIQDIPQTSANDNGTF